MSIVELISLGCSLVSATSELAHHTKKWKAKNARQKVAKRPPRRVQSQVQEESDSDTTELEHGSSVEDGWCTCSSSGTIPR